MSEWISTITSDEAKRNDSAPRRTRRRPKNGESHFALGIKAIARIKPCYELTIERNEK